MGQAKHTSQVGLNVEGDSYSDAGNICKYRFVIQCISVERKSRNVPGLSSNMHVVELGMAPMGTR